MEHNDKWNWGSPSVSVRPLTWLCSAPCRTAAEHSFMSWIRCSNLLNRVHLLLISCSTFERCRRWMFRSSWLTISVNQAHKRADLPTVLWIIAEKWERSRCICNVLHCFSSVSGVCHHQLLSDDYVFFCVCLFLQESSDSLDHTLLYLLSKADTSTR